MFTVLLPPGDNPIAVNKYTIMKKREEYSKQTTNTRNIKKYLHFNC